MKKIIYHHLLTEQPNPRSRELDSLSVEKAVALMNREDSLIAPALRRESKNIAKGVRLIATALRTGKHLFFAGAGTSGRLGVLESAELPPTFGTPPALARAFMAGGPKAVFRSQEGAEDNAPAARRAVARLVHRGDLLVGIAASGVTPFARAALAQAKQRGAHTILVTCNRASAKNTRADVVIAPAVGPEIIAGSTRLKAGTATKLVLNTLTTLAMVQWGKVHGNRMVDVHPSSHKLRERALRLVVELTGFRPARARVILKNARGHVKTAVLMARKNINYDEAQRRLKIHQGFLRKALVK